MLKPPLRFWRSLKICLSGLTGLLGLFAATWLLAAPNSPLPEPGANQQGVFPLVTVSASFDEPMAPSSINNNTMVIHGTQQGLVSGGVSLGNQARTAIFSATQPFWPGDLLQTTITTATTNISGEHSTAPFVWQFRIASGQASGIFRAAVTPTLSTGPSSVVVGDFNGDGRRDLAVASALGTFPNGAVDVLFGDGAGNFTAGPRTTVGLGAIALTGGDFNRDGNLDLATANAGTDVSPGKTTTVLLGDGSGNFAAATYGVGTGPRGITSADFNGDAILDLAVTNSGGISGSGNTVSVLLGDGAGVFSNAFTPTVDMDPGGIAAGDVNLDGTLDLAIANDNSGTISILTNDGLSQFSNSFTITVGGQPSNLTTADFDGDGRLDLAATNDFSHVVSILVGSGTGEFATSQSVSVGTRPETVVAGDVDGDGDIDLAAANTNNGNGNTVSMLTGNGQGGFSLAATLTTSPGPLGLALGDLDGDNDLDLAVTNVGNQGAPGNTVTVFCNLNGPLCRLAAPFGVELSPGQTTTADRGQAVNFTHTVTNTGNLPDTYVLSHRSSRGWAVDRPPQIWLGPGLATSLAITVHVPAGAAGLADQTTLTATSGLSAANYAAVLNQTYVAGADRVYLPLVLKDH
jgi:hypothetical protein